MSIQTPHTVDRRIATEPTTLALANSVVELEDGPAGVVASIRHRGGDVDFAGPLDDDTIGALRAVGAEVGR